MHPLTVSGVKARKKITVLRINTPGLLSGIFGAYEFIVDGAIISLRVGVLYSDPYSKFAYVNLN